MKKCSSGGVAGRGGGEYDEMGVADGRDEDEGGLPCWRCGELKRLWLLCSLGGNGE
jgi:hypothetical protein